MDTVYEHMVFSEVTIAVPLIVGYAYHKGSWKGRTGKKWSQLLERSRRGWREPGGNREIEIQFR